MKIKQLNQGFLYIRIVFLRYKYVFLRMNTSDDSSHFLSCSFLEIFTFFLSFFLDPSSYCPSLHFIAILLLPLVGFMGIFVPSAPPPVIFYHEGRFLGVFLLFRPFIQHLMWLTLGDGSLKCRGDCYIGLCVFFDLFPKKAGEGGRPRTDQRSFHDWPVFSWEVGLLGRPRKRAQVTSCWEAHSPLVGSRFRSISRIGFLEVFSSVKVLGVKFWSTPPHLTTKL